MMCGYRSQRGSGAVGLMLLLPLMLLVLTISLEVGRVLMIRSLLIEGVADSARMAQVATAVVSEAELERRWQTWAEQMPLLGAVTLERIDVQRNGQALPWQADNTNAEQAVHRFELNWQFQIPLLIRRTLSLTLSRHVVWEGRP